MSILIKLIQALRPQFSSQEAIDDAYLAESVNIHDLERRMRELDYRSRTGNFNAMTTGHSMP